MLSRCLTQLGPNNVIFCFLSMYTGSRRCHCVSHFLCFFRDCERLICKTALMAFASTKAKDRRILLLCSIPACSVENRAEFMAT